MEAASLIAAGEAAAAAPDSVIWFEADLQPTRLAMVARNSKPRPAVLAFVFIVRFLPCADVSYRKGSPRHGAGLPQFHAEPYSSRRERARGERIPQTPDAANPAG